MAVGEYALGQQGDVYNDNVTWMLEEAGLLGSSANVARDAMSQRSKRAAAMLGRCGMPMDRRESVLGRTSGYLDASNILVLPLQELAAISKEPDVYANAQEITPGIMYFGGTEISE